MLYARRVFSLEGIKEKKRGMNRVIVAKGKRERENNKKNRGRKEKERENKQTQPT
jgi:hypothetical protein